MMSGGTLNSNSISSENEQRLVMLGKCCRFSAKIAGSITLYFLMNMIYLPFITLLPNFLFLAGDGKTDADDETCRTFIFRYRNE